MGDAIAWWVTIELLGIVALPIAAVLLRPLYDRGYAVAKILGLLLVGWLGYTLAMMHVLPFERWSLALCTLAVATFSGWLLYRNGRALLNELSERYRTASFIRYIVVAELLFAVAYTIWAIFRAYNPDIFAQEKFMDFGFLNAILKSGMFPPNDMWFAGQSINYYYFGYVLMAALTSLSGVPSQIAFNLANVVLFALTALASFGFAYNLIAGALSRRVVPSRLKVPARAPGAVAKRRNNGANAKAKAQAPPQQALPVRQSRGGQPATSAVAAQAPVAVLEKRSSERTARTTNGRDGNDGSPPMPREYGPAYEAADLDVDEVPRVPFYLSPYIYAVLAALMVVAMGNLTTMFAKKNPANDIEGNGWSFCFNCYTPETFDWWGPSRIILDYRTTQVPGQPPQKEKVGYETINEFPAFSFLLADMHPHVMALPLVLLAITAAYAVSRRKVLRATRWRDGLPRGLEAWLSIAISGIIIGSLYTTNTWDYPTYLLVLLAGLGLPYLALRVGWRRILPWLVQAAIIVVLSLLSFVFFHLTFKSLLSGQPEKLPDNVANLPIIGWLLTKLSALLIVNTADKTILGFLVIFGIFLTAIVVWLAYELISLLRTRIASGQTSNTSWAILGGVIAAILLVAFFTKFPLLAFLLPLAILAVFIIWQTPGQIERNLALAMFAIAALIGLAVEIVFLRDNFQMRMNTLFKFYYQIWVLWALVAAFAIWKALSAAFGSREEANARGRVMRATQPIGYKALASVWAGVFGLLVLSGLMYSYYGPMSRQVGSQPVFRGLDGSTHFKGSAPGDYDAIYWLKANGTGSDVVLECCGMEYVTHAGRVSAFTGVPTLLAWDNSHEALWRSGQPALEQEIPVRRHLVNSIYQGVDPSDNSPLTSQRLLELLHQYRVDYVFVGASERNAVGAQGNRPEELLGPNTESIFKQVLTEAFRSGDTVIYKVPPVAAGGAAQQGQPSGPAAHP